MTHLLYYLHRIVAWVKSLFNRSRRVRLAVVGTTGSGKTYLLTDIVGSLERLGYKRDDSYKDSQLHRDAYSLTEEQSADGSVRKTVVYPCRLENVYVSRFIDPSDAPMMIEFADVPGEVMRPDSIAMFRAVMKSMMACTNKVFYSTLWRNPQTHQCVYVVKLAPSGDSNRLIVDGLDGSVGNASLDSALGNVSNLRYVSTATRQAYYERQGFVSGPARKVSGAHLFKHFLEYDTDSVINVITEAWSLLKVDQVLPRDLLDATGSGKMLFQNELRNHFFFHYYTFFATDVVVCDLCCTPVGGKPGQEAEDLFPTMMQSLKAMTAYEDLPQKNWYLALKGMDAVMCEDGWRSLYELSGGDINLVYSHFTAMLALANRNVKVDKPLFDSPEEMMEWLTCNRGHDTNAELVETLYGQYDAVEESASTLFQPAGRYRMMAGRPLDSHVDSRMKIFRQVDERLSLEEEGKSVWNILRMPQHVYFVATPIDDDFHICSHSGKDYTSFDGNARHYAQRVEFGTLQLTTGILLHHDLEVKPALNDYGNLLAYIHGADL